MWDTFSCGGGVRVDTLVCVEWGLGLWATQGEGNVFRREKKESG